MATSEYVTAQYSAEEFVESCGTILLNLSQETKEVCLIYYEDKDEWLLPKGRRNCGESRHEAALREAKEETGYCCHLHAVTMPTRAPPKDEEGHIADHPRVYPNIKEPFFLTFRMMEGCQNVKIIFWYIAAVDDDVPTELPHREAEFHAAFFSFDQALEKLTFREDRKILQRAIFLLDKA